MADTQTEVRLKAKVTNWLLGTLIACVTWIGQKQIKATEDLTDELKRANLKIAVHEADISSLRATDQDLKAGIDRLIQWNVNRPVGKHEDFYELPPKPQTK